MSGFRKAAVEAPSEMGTSFLKRRRGGTTGRGFKDTSGVRGQGSVTDEENENDVDVLAITDDISCSILQHPWVQMWWLLWQRFRSE